MGLKESKKFAIGSIHENGGGKFEILERWYDNDTDTIMLRYKFQNDGRIEENKEANVNASEWKWKKGRGLLGKSDSDDHHNETCITPTAMEEYFEGIYIRIERARTERKEDISQLTLELKEQTKMIAEMMSLIKIQQKEIDSLSKDNSIITKLLDKIK